MRGAPTSTGSSGNITVWGAYVDFALVVTNSFVLLITSAVGTAANLFVILAVCRQKSLQTSVNAPVVNLAVVDFLRCTVDCPVLLHVIVTLHRGGHVDRLICDTQTEYMYARNPAELSHKLCICLLFSFFLPPDASHSRHGDPVGVCLLHHVPERPDNIRCSEPAVSLRVLQAKKLG
uniref:G-protein coupled receptors family 1 profile domain-containing protein n=1 Tax=Poecilia latipinna TaxID=48699 RepID=A0A3B3TP54_9TELE